MLKIILYFSVMNQPLEQQPQPETEIQAKIIPFKPRPKTSPTEKTEKPTGGKVIDLPNNNPEEAKKDPVEQVYKTVGNVMSDALGFLEK